jgi:hypothetical protein
MILDQHVSVGTAFALAPFPPSPRELGRRPDLAVSQHTQSSTACEKACTPLSYPPFFPLVSKEELRLVVIPPDASVQLHQPEPHDPGARSSRN